MQRANSAQAESTLGACAEHTGTWRSQNILLERISPLGEKKGKYHENTKIIEDREALEKRQTKTRNLKY